MTAEEQQLPAPKPPLSKWKRGLLLTLLFVLIALLLCAIVYYYWDSIHKIPSVTEVALLFGLMPVSVASTVVVVLAKKARKQEAEYARSQSDKSNTALPQTAALTEATAQLPRLALVATSMVAKSSVDELLDLVKQGSTAIALDETLLDDSGFPIRSARINDLEVSEDVNAFLERYQQDHSVQIMNLTVDYSAVYGRKLALLEQLLTQMLEEGILPRFLEAHAGLDVFQNAEIKPLQILWHLNPQDATVADLFSQYTEHFLNQAEEIVVKPKTYIHTHLVALPDTTFLPMAGFWTYFNLHYLQEQKAWPHMLMLSLDSQCCEEQVDALADEGLLSNANTPGIIPSEGAAAVWLGAFQKEGGAGAEANSANAANGATSEPIEHAAWLCYPVYQTVQKKRQGSRVDVEPLKRCLAELEQRNMVKIKNVGLLQGDYSEKVHEILEICKFQMEAQLQIEELEERISIKQLLGDVGAPMVLMQLAIAAQKIEENSRPVLLAYSGEPDYRSLLLIQPTKTENLVDEEDVDPVNELQYEAQT